MYIRRFHGGALDCCNLITEDVLVEVYLHRMISDYTVQLELVPYFLFVRNGGFKKDKHKCKRDYKVQFGQPPIPKRPPVATIEKHKGARGFNSRHGSCSKNRNDAKSFSPLFPFHCVRKRQWLC